ncbi:RNA polymerase sigma factor [Thermosporothrix hazakensis]|nr:sigma-70 family RNA polymerase sigma factor [Thermosporothrix hazakensis]
MNAVENESRLVIEACEGSVTAFEALVVLYEPRIRRMIYGMTRDEQLTQDICQETFLSAYRALPRMNGHDLRFAPWLYRIALNQLRSEWRKRKHVTIVPFGSSAVGDNDTSFEEQVEDGALLDNPFEEGVAERDLVKRVLSRLPQNSVMCLLLDAEGFSYNEIAEIMQDTLSAVRSRLSRARQAFQRIYSGLDQEGRR